jgi:hypothetical protein
VRTTTTADPSTAAPMDQRSTVPDRARRAPDVLRRNKVQRNPFRPDSSGAVVNYLVGGSQATSASFFGDVKFMVYTRYLRISLSSRSGDQQIADR